MMHLAALGSSGLWAAAVPVDPDADQARRWIVAELSKPEYQAAQPTLFDRVSAAFWDWLTSLDLSGAGVGRGRCSWPARCCWWPRSSPPT